MSFAVVVPLQVARGPSVVLLPPTPAVGCVETLAAPHPLSSSEGRRARRAGRRARADRATGDGPCPGRPGQATSLVCRTPVRHGKSDYLRIFVTRPAPTVRPPSRMAKRRPSSMAIGWMRVTFISVLSPGMTISVPSGRSTTPVTSVVRK